MLERPESSGSGDRVPLSALFTGFLKVSLCGFGGRLVWARRVVVEQCQWRDRFRITPWQRIVRRGHAPLTVGLVIGGGYVMARSAAFEWQSVAIAAAALILGTRLNPLSILTVGGVLGGGGPSVTAVLIGQGSGLLGRPHHLTPAMQFRTASLWIGTRGWVR